MMAGLRSAPGWRVAACLLLCAALGAPCQARDVISVERKEHSYSDWNTGGARTRTEHTVRVNRRAVDGPALHQLMPADQAARLRSGFPIVQDTLALGDNDWLLMIVDGSGGQAHVLRLHAPRGKAVAELLPLPGRVAYHWFNDARHPGWTRIVTDTGTVLLRKRPFGQVDLGAGELVALEGGVAFLAVTDGEAAPAFRAVAIEGGSEVATLKLSPDCFALPAFELNFPRTAAYSAPSTQERINFADAPAWFQSQVRFEAGPPARLTLNATQRLRAPAPKRIAIAPPETDAGPQPRTLAQVNGGHVQAPMLRPHDGSDDVVPQLQADCQALNPWGATHPVKAPSGMATLMSAVSFCTEAWPVADDAKRARCVGQAQRTVISKGRRIGVGEVRLGYRPGAQGEAVQVRVPELQLDGEPLRFVTNTYQETQEIKEVFAIAPDDVLIKARDDGAYGLFRLTASGDEPPRLEQLETVAYPASPFSASPDGAWVYVRNAGALVQRQPFAMAHWRNVAAVRNGWILSWYIGPQGRDSHGTLHVTASRFDPAQRAPAAASLAFPTACRLDDDPFWEFAVPPVNATLEQSTQWFDQNFEFVETPTPALRLRAGHALRMRREGCQPTVP
jgi:hypothetical protein